MPKLKLISLYCETTEDNTGADEAYLLVNGRQVGGVNSINDRQSRDLTYIEPIAFTTSAEIRLYDQDTGVFDKDDFLGSLTATSAQAGRGEYRGRFNRDGADYTLTWEVLN
ncbi:MAG TPA: hypothetical protein V6D11_11955 [Waterburya sp.]|jgi:hypothetical protein